MRPGFVIPAAFDAAIIDLDGTMVDTLGDFAQALGRMLDDLALPGIERTHILIHRQCRRRIGQHANQIGPKAIVFLGSFHARFGGFGSGGNRMYGQTGHDDSLFFEYY